MPLKLKLKIGGKNIQPTVVSVGRSSGRSSTRGGRNDMKDFIADDDEEDEGALTPDEDTDENEEFSDDYQPDDDVSSKKKKHKKKEKEKKKKGKDKEKERYRKKHKSLSKLQKLAQSSTESPSSKKGRDLDEAEFEFGEAPPKAAEPVAASGTAAAASEETKQKEKKKKKLVKRVESSDEEDANVDQAGAETSSGPVKAILKPASKKGVISDSDDEEEGGQYAKTGIQAEKAEKKKQAIVDSDDDEKEVADTNTRKQVVIDSDEEEGQNDKKQLENKSQKRVIDSEEEDEQEQTKAGKIKEDMVEELGSAKTETLKIDDNEQKVQAEEGKTKDSEAIDRNTADANEIVRMEVEKAKKDESAKFAQISPAEKVDASNKEGKNVKPTDSQPASKEIEKTPAKQDDGGESGSESEDSLFGKAPATADDGKVEGHDSDEDSLLAGTGGAAKLKAQPNVESDSDDSLFGAGSRIARAKKPEVQEAPETVRITTSKKREISDSDTDSDVEMKDAERKAVEESDEEMSDDEGLPDVYAPIPTISPQINFRNWEKLNVQYQKYRSKSEAKKLRTEKGISKEEQIKLDNERKELQNLWNIAKRQYLLQKQQKEQYEMLERQRAENRRKEIEALRKEAAELELEKRKRMEMEKKIEEERMKQKAEESAERERLRRAAREARNKMEQTVNLDEQNLVMSGFKQDTDT